MQFMKVFALFPLLLLLGASCNLYKEVEMVEMIDMKVTEWSGENVRAEVYLQLKNPNWYKVRLTRSHVQLYLDGKEIGVVELSEALDIPPRSVTTHTMQLHADYEDIENVLGNMLNLLFKQKYVLEGKGYVRGRAFFIARKVPVAFREDLTREDIGVGK